MQDRFFVDKSMLIGELIPAFGRKNRYPCITRPRRFGKTVMASMIGAFFEKTVNRKTFSKDWKFPRIKTVSCTGIVMM